MALILINRRYMYCRSSTLLKRGPSLVWSGFFPGPVNATLVYVFVVGTAPRQKRQTNEKRESNVGRSKRKTQPNRTMLYNHMYTPGTFFALWLKVLLDVRQPEA